jgi:hypothetical protein
VIMRDHIGHRVPEGIAQNSNICVSRCFKVPQSVQLGWAKALNGADIRERRVSIATSFCLLEYLFLFVVKLAASHGSALINLRKLLLRSSRQLGWLLARMYLFDVFVKLPLQGSHCCVRISGQPRPAQCEVCVAT